MLKNIFKSVLLIAVFLASPAVSSPQEQGKTYRAAVDMDNVQRVEVTGGSYFFKPDHIIVTENIPVEFKVRKEPSILPHNLTIKAPEAGIDVEVALSSGETKTVRFTPTKKGKYEFYCNKKFLFFKSHREKGMKGVLEVE